MILKGPIFIAIPNDFITVCTLIKEGSPDGVLTYSIFLFLATFSISLELNRGPLSLFCQRGFPNVSYTSSSTGIVWFDLTSLTIG